MLRSLTINNFRCYVNTTVYFNGSSIIVGKNNAGKSTLIEALKIISSVTRKYKSLRFQRPPEWVPNDNNYGVCPNVENMNISDRGIFNMYGNPPAIIIAEFENNTSIKAYVGEDLSIFAIVFDEEGNAITGSSEARYVDIPRIEVLPQISAVLDNEKVLKKQTVDNNRSTRLASRNFRNQLYYYKEAFPNFKSLVESTWETLRVSPVETSFSEGGSLLSFFVRVNGFEAEISWMGHGLQMWMQTMWFISQCPSNSVVVLDEPDVYMHADLQRRLVRLIAPKFEQLIIATHSLEIIEEVPSDSIIPIDARKEIIKPIGDESSLQSITDNLGSPLNIDLARLFISKRFLILNCSETGRKILSAFQAILFPDDLHPIITFPKAYVSGGYEWAKVKTIADVFASNEMQLQIYCLLETGSRISNEFDYLDKNASSCGINLHIWEKTESENYAINPDVIFRYIDRNKRRGTITEIQLRKKIDEIAQKLETETISLWVEQLSVSDGIPQNKAQYEIEHMIKLKNCSPFDIIPGQKFFSELSAWAKVNYGIRVSSYQVASYFYPHEVPDEMKKVVTKIIKGQAF